MYPNPYTLRLKDDYDGSQDVELEDEHAYDASVKNQKRKSGKKTH